ncbi:flocculation protein FLO11 [Aplysia californica]|uniref:Flocculation protein FLO11 n=1 Tax=Aplysia californica TaxID=6500 RepID=A0ABM0KAT6_APLCA|nr:flocculation protein FLO11 [Aplysia californica]
MSSSEFAGMGTAVPPSYSQQNGRATTEKLSSVLENPFYKNFGRKHNVPSYQKDSLQSDVLDRRRLSGVIDSTSRNDESEDIGEYRPGSGFVHKLLDKFSSLSAKEDTAFSSSHVKRSSSLEDLTGSNSVKSKNVTFKDPASLDVKSGIGKPLSSVSKTSHRARSIESLPHAHRKSSHHHNLAIPLRHVETKKWDKGKDAVIPKSPRDSHVVAPDVDLARDDIIIIETTPSVVAKKDESNDESDSDNGTPRLLSYREESVPDELPKPNTVVNVRSLFETASVTSGTSVFRRPKPEPLKHIGRSGDFSQTGSVTSPSSGDESNKLVSVTSPRFVNNDTQANSVPFISPSNTATSPPIFSPRSSELSQPSFQSKHDENKSSSSVTTNSIAFRQRSASPQEVTSPRPDTTHSTTGDDEKTASPFRPSPTPRNTASVKPTIASKTNAHDLKPVPVPYPAPASAATSYKKSSPVVPVAPFKNKQDDKKDDGTPVMIFDKSKISPTKKRSPRTKDYTPLDNEISKKEVFTGGKKVSVTSVNVKSSGKGPIPDIPRENKNVSKEKPLNSRKSTENVSVNKLNDLEMKKSKAPVPVLEKKDITLERKTPTAPARRSFEVPPKNHIQEDRKALDKLSKPLPVKTASTAVSSSEPKPEPKQPSKMLYVSSSSDASESDATPPETPRTKPDKTKSDSEPIKGIPSIIAQRLKKEKNDPSQASSLTRPSSLIDRQLKSDSGETDSSTSSETFSPRVNLSSTPSVQSKDDNKDEISNSIENEIAAVRKRMEGNRSKATGVAQIFDSSQLAKKRKENQRQRATFNAQSQGLVPPLDLSSITDDKNRDYQPKPREIKPCNIVFVGENAKTSRSLLKKQRKVKINIHFNDSVTETFEYPSEDHALELYLEEHPHDTADILFLEDFGGGGGDVGESSDDTDTVDIIETPVTPRGNADDDLLKSNTALSSSSSLHSYRGRFQEEFVFGSSLTEPEPPPKVAKSEPVDDPDSMTLRPADEQELDTWSTNNSSDLLF